MTSSISTTFGGSGSSANKSTGPMQTGVVSDKPPLGSSSAVELNWPFPTAGHELAPDEIHVWCASLDGLVSDLPSFAASLSASERKRADRFQLDRDRDRFIVRHGLLRRLLARYLNAHPAKLSFTYESRAKPALAGTIDDPRLHFNLSQSDGLGLFAVSRQFPLGVDVERVRPIPDALQIAARFFSPRENAMLNALPAESVSEAFFQCWTRKEAYLKATGEGIAHSLPQVEVSLAPGRAAELLSIAGDVGEAFLWTIHALAPAAGFIGALAVRAKELKLACWRWSEIEAG